MNNREIKFRAWNGKKMNYEPLVSTYDTSVNSEFYFAYSGQSNLEFMQYTGLKDKNGKEIYESDVVIGNTSYERDSDECEWTKESPCIVEWHNECGGFYPFIMNNRWRCDVVNIEVIGNIYENPELL